MKIKLIPVTHYRVEIEGVSVGEFREYSRWNGSKPRKPQPSPPPDCP